MADGARARAGRLAARTRRLRTARGLSPIRKRASRRADQSATERRLELDELFGLPLSFRTHPAALTTIEEANGRPAPLWRFIFRSRERTGEWADTAELTRLGSAGAQAEGGWARTRRASRSNLQLPRGGDIFQVQHGVARFKIQILHGPSDGEGVLNGPIQSQRFERGTLTAYIFNI